MTRLMTFAFALLFAGGLTQPVRSWTYHVDATISYIYDATTGNYPVSVDYVYLTAWGVCDRVGMGDAFWTYPFIGQVMQMAGAGWCDFWRYPGEETEDESLGSSTGSGFFPGRCAAIENSNPAVRSTICYDAAFNLSLTDRTQPFCYWTDPPDGGSERWTSVECDASQNPTELLQRGWFVLYDYHADQWLNYTFAVLFVTQDQGAEQDRRDVPLVGCIHYRGWNNNQRAFVQRTLGQMEDWISVPTSNLFREFIKPVGSGLSPQFPADFVRQQREHKP